MINMDLLRLWFLDKQVLFYWVSLHVHPHLPRETHCTNVTGLHNRSKCSGWRISKINDNETNPANIHLNLFEPCVRTPPQVPLSVRQERLYWPERKAPRCLLTLGKEGINDKGWWSCKFIKIDKMHDMKMWITAG